MVYDNVSSDPDAACPPAGGTPVLRLLGALRAGQPLPTAAISAGLREAVAARVAASPLIRALLHRSGVS
jgi:hypothetical protein